jgi:hypothetical protein
MLDDPAVVCWSFTSWHLAAVLLKQYIKHHWEEQEENFVPPIVSASEKVLRDHSPFFVVECHELYMVADPLPLLSRPTSGKITRKQHA